MEEKVLDNGGYNFSGVRWKKIMQPIYVATKNRKTFQFQVNFILIKHLYI